MESSNNKISNAYFEKQNHFKSLVKEIQTSLNSKEYKQKGISLSEYIKMRWNISQIQSYRYLVCAKVLEQLKDFVIQPSYERLCRSLNSVAKTPSQMKLLWAAIIKKFGSKPETINSSHVTSTWKELCKNDKYSSICHLENKIIKKVENTLHSRIKKHRQIRQKIHESIHESIKNSELMNQISHIPVLRQKIHESIKNSELMNQISYIPTLRQKIHESIKRSVNFSAISYVPSNSLPEVSNNNLIAPVNTVTGNNLISPILETNTTNSNIIAPVLDTNTTNSNIITPILDTNAANTNIITPIMDTNTTNANIITPIMDTNTTNTNIITPIMDTNTTNANIITPIMGTNAATTDITPILNTNTASNLLSPISESNTIVSNNINFSIPYSIATTSAAEPVFYVQSQPIEIQYPIQPQPVVYYQKLAQPVIYYY